LVDYYEDTTSLLPEFCNTLCSRRKKNDNEDDDDDDEDDDGDNDVSKADLLVNMKRTNTIADDLQIEIETQEFDEEQIDANQKLTFNNTIQLKKIDIKKNKFQIYWQRYFSFTQSPKVHFFYDTFFYTVFLFLFSYMLLCDYGYYETIYEEVAVANLTEIEYASLNSDEPNAKMLARKIVKNPSVIEILLVFWIFSFLFEELIQVCSN